MAYSLAEAERINAEATPWPEIEALAREANEQAQRDELARRIIRERPYMALADAYATIATARGSEPE